MKRLVFETKYWTALVEGSTLRTQFGKLGSPGQIRLKPFATPAAATAALADAIAEKQREGYRATRADPIAAKPTAAKPKPFAKAKGRRGALVALAAQLGGEAVAKEVALAIDAPEVYVKKYAARGDDRDLDPDAGNLAWIALVDGLQAKKRLAGLDWKHEAKDTLSWIKGLASPAGKRALAPLLADAEMHERRTTGEVLELAGAALATTGEALLQLDIVSDSYEMVVVAATDVTSLVKLARAAGETIVHFKGKQPGQLDKARVREAARSKKARADPWGELLEDSMFQNAQDVLFDIRQRDGALAKIRAAVPHVPAGDRPFVELAVQLNSKSALAVARNAKDARLCLRAAQFMAERSPAQIATRLRAIVILVRRLKLSPNPGKDHEIAALALDGYGNDDAIDAALAALPAADRDLLARLGDGLVAGARRGTDQMSEALCALKSVGDATSLALLEAKGNGKGDRGDAMARIRKRTKAAR